MLKVQSFARFQIVCASSQTRSDTAPGPAALEMAAQAEGQGDSAFGCIWTLLSLNGEAELSSLPCSWQKAGGDALGLQDKPQPNLEAVIRQSIGKRVVVLASRWSRCCGECFSRP